VLLRRSQKGSSEQVGAVDLELRGRRAGSTESIDRLTRMTCSEALRGERYLHRPLEPHLVGDLVVGGDVPDVDADGPGVRLHGSDGRGLPRKLRGSCDVLLEKREIHERRRAPMTETKRFFERGPSCLSLPALQQSDSSEGQSMWAFAVRSRCASVSAFKKRERGRGLELLDEIDHCFEVVRQLVAEPCSRSLDAHGTESTCELRVLIRCDVEATVPQELNQPLAIVGVTRLRGDRSNRDQRGPRVLCEQWIAQALL
jgi:hypothetical protein